MTSPPDRFVAAPWWLGALVVALAVGLRVGWVLLVPSKPVGDFAMYLESAVYLAEHGAVDPEFVYMPGYVLLAAAVLALGGGLLAVKLVGAVLAGLAAGAVYGLGTRLWDGRAGLVAGLGYALWPGGVAVASVTGTDMPAGALLLLAAWALVRIDGGPGAARRRPWLATAVFGLLMGLGAYVRAVAVPLAGFALFYFLAAGDRWSRAAARAALAGVLALLVLAPWGFRNRARYGEWFITDSHGGLTALVGANPNTDGRYSRTLNRVFREATGYTLLAEPHRQADRASYQLARRFTGFSLPFAAGLVVAKAERLLDHQRALLYWPLYRQGVLREGGVKRFFDGHRRGIERLVDLSWLLLVGGFAVGVAVALARRRWLALAFVPVQGALVGIYALYFAEVRYQLPITALMFPLAGAAASALVEGLRQLRQSRAFSAPLRREAAFAGAALVLVLVGWPALRYAGERLRARHRFAVHVCTLPGGAGELRKDVCLWRKASSGDSPLRGIHDGVGLRLAAGASVAAETPLPLAAGRYRLRARLDVAPAPADNPAGLATLLVGGRPVGKVVLADLVEASRHGRTADFDVPIEHPGGDLILRLAVQVDGPMSEQTTAWLAGLEVARP